MLFVVESAVQDLLKVVCRPIRERLAFEQLGVIVRINFARGEPCLVGGRILAEFGQDELAESVVIFVDVVERRITVGVKVVVAGDLLTVDRDLDLRDDALIGVDLGLQISADRPSSRW